MTRKRVLAVGIDPAFADPDVRNGFGPDVVRAHIEAQLGELRTQGYDVTSCLIDPTDASGGDVAVRDLGLPFELHTAMALSKAGKAVDDLREINE